MERNSREEKGMGGFAIFRRINTYRPLFSLRNRRHIICRYWKAWDVVRMNTEKTDRCQREVMRKKRRYVSAASRSSKGGKHRECDWSNQGGLILQPLWAVQEQGSRCGGEWIQTLGLAEHVYNKDKKVQECAASVPLQGQHCWKTVTVQKWLVPLSKGGLYYF